jgi:hypothetical protein
MNFKEWAKKHWFLRIETLIILSVIMSFSQKINILLSLIVTPLIIYVMGYIFYCFDKIALKKK